MHYYRGKIFKKISRLGTPQSPLEKGDTLPCLTPSQPLPPARSPIANWAGVRLFWPGVSSDTASVWTCLYRFELVMERQISRADGFSNSTNALMLLVRNRLPFHLIFIGTHLLRIHERCYSVFSALYHITRPSVRVDQSKTVRIMKFSP